MDSSKVKDSSIYFDPSMFRGNMGKDPYLRTGIVKSVDLSSDSDLRYLVEVLDKNDKIPINCRMMTRFGGVYNYEDVVYRGYKTNDKPDPIQNLDAKAGDIVIVAFFNGEGREGIILGGITHAARDVTLDATLGPQYMSEFNGMNTNINANGEWILTFRGQPTNLSGLLNLPRDEIPAPIYDTNIGSSFMKFDMNGGWTVSDNATSDPQSFVIDKAAGTVTTTSGQISLKMTKADQSVILTSKTLTINSSESISENTKDYHLIASATAKFDSPKVAIGHQDVELLDQLTQLIDALGKILPLSPVGPCTMLNTVADWPVIESIKAKINQIKGSL